jgi:hypothetical protein
VSEQYRIVGSGEVVAIDDRRRDPRLVGSLSWAAPQKDSTTSALLRRSEAGLPWESSAWGELVVDCPCEDCQAQRAATIN